MFHCVLTFLCPLWRGATKFQRNQRAKGTFFSRNTEGRGDDLSLVHTFTILERASKIFNLPPQESRYFYITFYGKVAFFEKKQILDADDWQMEQAIGVDASLRGLLYISQVKF